MQQPDRGFVEGTKKAATLNGVAAFFAQITQAEW